MKITRLVLMIVLGTVALSACGGGGSADVAVASSPTKAVMKISTTGTLGPGTLIGGITVVAVLPAGVSVKATPDAQNPSVLVTDSGVVTASGMLGTNAMALATYDEAARQVTIDVLDQNGFGTGEFVTVNCVINSGSPTAAAFSVQGLDAKDLNGASISGLTAGYAVEIH